MGSKVVTEELAPDEIGRPRRLSVGCYRASDQWSIELSGHCGASISLTDSDMPILLDLIRQASAASAADYAELLNAAKRWVALAAAADAADSQTDTPTTIHTF